MKHVTVMLILAFLAITATAAAQQAGSNLSIATHDPRGTGPRVTQSSSEPAPPPRMFVRKRRGSMVGYIQDATVASQVRFRFDAGFENDAPDRAEFFYGKCGCHRQLAKIAPAAYDPKAPGPGPGIVTDLNFQQLYLQGQVGLIDRVALFAELPIRFIQPQKFDPSGPPGTFGNQSGLSDLRVGGKVALVSTLVTTLTFQVQGYFRTGDASKGLGTHRNSVEPALLSSVNVTDRVAIEAQLGLWHPLDGSAGVPTASSEKFSGDIYFYGIGPSFELINNESFAFSPVVELVGWHVAGGFLTGVGDASGTNIVNLKLGGRASFNRGNSVYAGYGRALTDAGWYRNILRLEYRMQF